jgi:hypothetical protein
MRRKGQAGKRCLPFKPDTDKLTSQHRLADSVALPGLESVKAVPAVARRPFGLRRRVPTERDRQSSQLLGRASSGHYFPLVGHPYLIRIMEGLPVIRAQSREAP